MLFRSARGFSLLTATPLALRDGLLEQARAHGVQVQWMGPWWVRGLACWLSRPVDAPGAGAASTDAAPALAVPSQAGLTLQEPGWSWQAWAQAEAADASPWRGQPASRWTLTALQPLGAELAHSTQPAQDVWPVWAADASPSWPGDGAAHCLPVSLARLQGEGATWGAA